MHDITVGKMRGKATRGRKRMHLLSNLMKGKYVALKRTARQERVAEVVRSWKSYTCFSADYLNE